MYIFDLLDDKIKESAIYREKYPESSLLELSNIMTLETGNKISKSCLNHRFRKIKEFADKMNTTQQRVSEWECNKVEPSLYNILRIIKVLNTSFEELTDGIE